MKIEFEDKSYIEISKSKEANKITVTICAKDYMNAQKTIANSVEITKEQLKELIDGLY